MDADEIRLRCLEAASKTPMVHLGGHPTGVLETAKMWADWVAGLTAPPPAGKNTLHLKK